MPKYEVGRRVHHTKLGYGTIFDNKDYTWVKPPQVAVRFDVMPDPNHRMKLDDMTEEDRYIYGFNEDGSHFSHDTEVFRGELSLCELPAPDDWYEQLVE